MITSTIGKIFLDAYNKKYSTDYDAKTFFVEVYFPLFFGNSKYLQWTQNSPFVQGLVSTDSGETGTLLKGKDDKSLSFSSEDAAKKYIQDYQISNDDIIEIKKEKNKAQYKVIRRLKADDFQFMLKTFISKVENCKVPDASIAIGYPASEEKEFATTSGQVTNIQFKTETDDIYYSWFGSSLGIGLQGGISILFAEPEILLDLFVGWKIYRDALSNTPKLKANKINSWNGQWLAHRYDKNGYFAEEPMANFTPFETSKEEGLSVSTQSWTKVLIGISRHFDSPKMMGYVYNLGKTNTTLGFIPFDLEHIRRPIELYKKLFDEEEGQKAEELWGTENGFRACCQKGAIGIEAMQPQGLTQYMVAKGKDVKLPKYNEKQIINFHTYQIWLLAMLNNQEMWDKSLKFAQALNAYAASGSNGKTTNSRQIDEVLKATNKRNFIEALSNIASVVPEIGYIQEVAMTVHNMPTDNVPYFLTLVRFHAEALKNQKNNQLNLPL